MVSIAGNVLLKGSRAGVPEASVILCSNTGREVFSIMEGTLQAPPRDQIQEIRISTAEGLGDLAKVSIVSAAPECSNARQTRTDAAGHFAFGDVMPGIYKIHAQRSGYIGEAPPGSSTEFATQTVSVAAQQSSFDLSLLLIKGGTIAGKVRDSRGMPAVSVNVQVWSAKSTARQIPIVSVQTNDRGEYRLFWLPPGEFIISARPVPRGPSGRPSISDTYYKNGDSASTADRVALTEGEEISGIDFVLRSQP